MEETKVIFTFELENGNTHTVSVKDLRSDLDPAELIALGNKMIEMDGQYNGSKFLLLTKCDRIVTNKESLI